MQLQQTMAEDSGDRAAIMLRALILEAEATGSRPRFTEALRIALRIREEGDSVRDVSSGGVAFMAPYRMRRAKEFLEANLSLELRLEDIAAAAGLSPYHFCRQFKRSTGTSPLRYVLERRIERAKRLIESTDQSLVDIALELGFSSQSHFTAMFRKLTGLTPRRYREVCRD